MYRPPGASLDATDVANHAFKDVSVVRANSPATKKKEERKMYIYLTTLYIYTHPWVLIWT